MGQEENDSRIKTREKRQIKYMKEAKRRSIVLIIILTICICLLIINNFKTYEYCDKMALELRDTKKVYLQQFSDYNDLKKKVNNLIGDKQDQFGKGVTNVSLSDDLLKELREKIDELIHENESLRKHNNELSGDNISLQNSLKLAAMAGIKPKNYERPPQITSRAIITRDRYIGKFKGTAYTPSKSECGNNRGITYSGKPIVPGTTIAVDTKYWPIGTVFYIKGIGYVTAMDTGNKVKGKYRFDFAVFDKKFANILGSRYWDVYLVKKGTGKID